MSFLRELKRRNVFRVGAAYVLASWVLLQIADFVLEVIVAPDWILQVLVLIAIIGLPAVLAFSWVFEMTPTGIKRESEIDRSKSVAPDAGRKLDRVIISFLTAAVIILLAERFTNTDQSEPAGGRSAAESSQLAESLAERAPTGSGAADVPVGGRSAAESAGGSESRTGPMSTEPSIAVLPFVNMSSDPEQEFFSDGIAEEILNVLTRIPNLKVAARTSSFKFKGQQLDAADIGRQLQVNHLLEGSVRKSGKTLRITAQLIETDSGFHMWSKTFDRQMEDVFAVQDEIAAAIASELQASLSGALAEPSTTVDLAAYELFLKGRGLVAERKEASLLQAIEYLKAAHDIDATYAPTMAMLATAYAVLPWFSFHLPAGEARTLARDWAISALEQQPDNVDALAIMGLVNQELEQNWAGAQAMFEKALAINPGNLTVNNLYGDFLMRTADFDKALIYETKALELDPLSVVMHTDLAQLLVMMGEYDRAIALAKKARELDWFFLNAVQVLGDSYYLQGDVDSLEKLWKEVEEAQSSVDELQFSTVLVEYMLATQGQRTARKHLDFSLDMIESGRLTPAFVAFDMSLYGDFDASGELLLQAYEADDGTWTFPLYVRLPEQAPDSAPWQEFWSKPRVAELAVIRRNNGFAPDIPVSGGVAEK